MRYASLELLPIGIVTAGILCASILMKGQQILPSVILPQGIHVHFDYAKPAASSSQSLTRVSLDVLKSPLPASQETITSKKVPHPALTAITSFAGYGPAAASVIGRKHARFEKLSPEHLKLASELGYGSHFESAKKGARVNAKFGAQIAEYARELYGLHDANGSDSKVDYGLADLALGHLARDWSEVGSAERAQVMPPILDALREGLVGVDGMKRVLVPGAALGRLAHEIANEGYSVDANEYDYGSILTYHYMLNHTSSLFEHTIYPFATKWTHQMNPAARFRPVHFPDMLPTSNVNLIEGDFLIEFPESEMYDAVVTLFFIDVCENIIDFLSTIHRVLKPGGLWINLGPLKWGAHSQMQLSAQEVLQLADLLGFEVDHGSHRSIETVYTAQPETLLKFTYVTQFWTARKR